MVFRFKELATGLKHWQLGWTRNLLKRPDNCFIKDYSQYSLVFEKFSLVDGQPALCPICGYAMMRAELPNGWLYETCSAHPVAGASNSVTFKDWITKLAASKDAAQNEGIDTTESETATSKLPTSCV